ncbi:DUF3173 family protein [Limosilactobacillus mucosae]|uniref:DUF3173 family protein n=1 Tax=Limosilactobacillus mucosae TaxID=97478 RepID=UPI003994DAD2
MKKVMINCKFLCDLGFPENQARRIIRQAKLDLVAQGLGFYNGKRVGMVPVTAVEKIIGISLSEDNENVEL